MPLTTALPPPLPSSGLADEGSLAHDSFRSLAWRITRWEIVGILGPLVLFIIISLLVVSQGSPLGHDEAVYAARAREMVNGEPLSSWWAPNRAPGLPLLLTLAWKGTVTDSSLRLIVTSFGALLLLATWVLGRLLVGPGGAMIAAFGIAVSPVILMSASNVWPDVPGAAVGMAALCVYAYGLVSSRFRWWTVALVIALSGVATMTRYGAPIPLVIGLVGLTLWKWPAERERKVRVVTAALGIGILMAIILMTPLLTGAGSPVETISSRDPAHNPIFGGFGDYWGLREQVFAGSTVVGLAAAAIGILGVATNRTLRRDFLFPFAVLVCTFVALATVVHGEVRYLSPILPWLWLCAGAALVWRFSHMPKPATLAMAVCAVVALAVFAPEQADSEMEVNQGFINMKKAALTLRSDSECTALTSLLYTPMVEWYSGCETAAINHGASLPDGPLYLLIIENARNQEQNELIGEYFTSTTATPIDSGDSDSRFPPVEVWRLSD